MAEIEDNKVSKPRDLLQRFVCDFPVKYAAEERISGGENIELSLGLSMNGRFGVDPHKGNSLIRSSSVSNFVMRYSTDETATAAAAFPITRTCSLPAATGEEVWKQKKEMQSLRRLEAKRKRVEKMKNGRVVKEKLQEGDQNSDDNGRGSVVNNDSEGMELKSENMGVEKPQFYSQGSIGSQGSSGISDFENQPIRGTSRYTDNTSPPSEHSQPEQKPFAAAGNAKQGNVTENGSSASIRKVQKEEMVRNIMMGDMPCVTTKGEGADGKKIQGFLYRYKKGEEVKIMCVCHGNFHSPAEFVKHGGGGEVENPLRHIVISPVPFC